MKFTTEAIDSLRHSVGDRLSLYRTNHTLGVEQMAVKLAEYCLPDRVDEIRAAALLHDISKELSSEEQMSMLMSVDGITDSDLMSAPAHHAFTAPLVVRRDFSEFATTDVLSALFNHTTGAPDMSVFDEIIFIADYIEPGRKYPMSISLRERLMASLEAARDGDECVARLHDAVIESLDNTIRSLVDGKKIINERTVSTRNAFIARRPMPIQDSDLGEINGK